MNSDILIKDEEGLDPAYSSKQSKLREFLLFLLEYATTLRSVGGQTSRIVQNTARIAETYGYHMNMIMLQKNTSMTIIELMPDGRETRHTATRVMEKRNMPLNFYINQELSALSWYIHDNRPPLEEAKRHFKEIISKKRLGELPTLLLASAANAAFCGIFQGDIPAMLFVFLGTAAGFFMKQKLTNLKVNHWLVVVVAAFVASFATALFLNPTIYCYFPTFLQSQTPDIALGTSVLFLIPGVPLINSLMDWIEGYYLSGISHFGNACTIIGCLTIGLTITLMIANLQLV